MKADGRKRQRRMSCLSLAIKQSGGYALPALYEAAFMICSVIVVYVILK